MTPGATQKHLFYSEMAKLLEAGFDIRKAAAVLADTRLPAAQEILLKDLNRGLESGQTIAAAFGADRDAISDLERHIVSAGERGGTLAPAFAHLAGYFGMIAAARSQLIKGMIYPAIVLHIGVVVGTIPMDLMKQAGFGAMAGHFLLALLTLYALVAVVLLVARLLWKRAPGDPATDRLLQRIPWIGKARRAMAMARFCKVYHSCLLAGISMKETAELSAGASRSALIGRAGTRLAQTAAAGGALGPVMVAEAAFPRPFARSYATGEEAGTLDSDLARWSGFFETEARAASETVAVMVPKVLYFLILLFVAWKIVAFFNGYYSGLLNQLDA
jgi:general secretion pathway protein F